MKKYRQFCPDLVFIFNSDGLSPKAVREFSYNSKLVIWLFDSIHRFPHAIDNLQYADALFCYEESDIPYIEKSLGIKAHFLPQAVDTSLYFPIESSKKKYDIVFAGDIWQSRRRQDFLQYLVTQFPTNKLAIYGIYKPWYKGFLKWLTRERRDIYKNKNTTAEQLNKLYNTSNIALNIHVEQQRNGANPKVYEIAASGVYQICDSNPYIKSLFQNGEVGLYNNETEMLSLIDWALNPQNAQEREEKAQAAHKIIIDNHTFVKRVEQMLDVVNNK